MACRQFGLASVATTQQSAFVQQLLPGCAMNRTIDATATQQTGICSIYNRIQRQRGDIRTNYIQVPDTPSIGGYLFAHSKIVLSKRPNTGWTRPANPSS